jgi:hypothetical protein
VVYLNKFLPEFPAAQFFDDAGECKDKRDNSGPKDDSFMPTVMTLAVSIVSERAMPSPV